MSLSADIQYTVIAADNVYTNRLTPVSAVPWPNRFEPTLTLPYTTTQFNPENIIWDFGDGNTFTGVSAEHVYSWPGQYDITLTVVNEAGEPVKSTQVETVNVQDFIPTHMQFRQLPDVVDIPASRLANPITVDFMLSWQNYTQQNRPAPQCDDQQQHFMNVGKTPSTWMCGESHHTTTISPPIYTFNLYASGSDAKPLNLEEYKTDKYGHLDLDWSFHSATPTLSTVPITSIDVSIYDPVTGSPGDLNTYELLYYKPADDNEYIRTTSNDTGAVFVGLSGNTSFYYRDDVTKCPSSRDVPLLVSVELDEHKLHDKLTTNHKNNTLIKYRNSKPLVANNIKPRVNEAIKLNITSTGINNFTINRNKWEHSEIHFTVTVQDAFGFNILDFANFDTGFELGLVDTTTGLPVPVSGDNYCITTIDDQQLGHYKGTLFYNGTAENVQLTASLDYTQLSGYKTDAIVGWLNNYRPDNGGGEYGSIYRYYYGDQVMYDGTVLSDNISTSYAGQGFTVETNGIISDMIVLFAGQDLTTPPRIEVQDPQGDGAVLAPRFNAGSGSITDVVVLSGGKAYTTTPTIYFTANNEATLPNASAVVDFNYQLKNIAVAPPSDTRPDSIIWSLESGATPRLVQIDAKGVLLTSEALSGITTNPGNPNDIAIDNNDDVFVCTENKVVRIDPSDRELVGVYWSRPLATDSSLGPSCIEVDKTSVYICDETVVTKINKYTTANIQGTATLPEDGTRMLLLSNGTLNVLTGTTPRLIQIDVSNMNINRSISLPAGTYNALTTTTDGNIYTVRDSRYLHKITATGDVSTVWDFGTGAVVTSVCGDSRGFIWAPDDYNRYIWMVDVITTKTLTINNDPTTLKVDMVNYNLYPTPNDGDTANQTMRAIGDWTGFHWLQKFGYIPGEKKELTGSSSTFNIHSKQGTYNIRKFNEDHDPGSTIKSYALQPWLNDQYNLFDEALPSMIGNSNSAPTELGKTIYEKIANFANNNSDLDECNIDVIHNQTLMYDMEIQMYNLQYPPTFKRLMDMCSIKQTKLYGTFDYTTETFDMYTNYTNKDTRENLGEVLNFSDHMLTPGETIVAYEKFSKIYTPITITPPMSGVIDNNDNIVETGLDTNLVSSDTQQYPLSSYTSTWGWRLVAPLTISGKEILNYYRFYTYNSSTTANQVEGVIHWNNPDTTLTPETSTYESWSEDTGVLDNILEHQLRTGLGLFADVDTHTSTNTGCTLTAG